jgi:hypothetical protein
MKDKLNGKGEYVVRDMQEHNELEAIHSHRQLQKII